jgi:glutamate N-acetyltransferase/amino-acid N-acetyltransferase
LAAVGRSNITHLKADEVNIYLGEVCIVSRGELDERYTEAAGSAQMAKDNIVVTIEIGNNDTQESVCHTM